MTHIESVSSGLQAFSRTVADTWHRWRELGNLSDYWQRCPAEADRLALDMGLQPVELMRLSGRRVISRNLLRERLNALGIKADTLESDAPEHTRDLARVCALCDSKARCARDLKRRPESGIWRTYCPNEPTLNQITSDAVIDRICGTLNN